MRGIERFAYDLVGILHRIRVVALFEHFQIIEVVASSPSLLMTEAKRLLEMFNGCALRNLRIRHIGQILAPTAT